MDQATPAEKVFPVCFCIDRSASMGTRVISPSTQKPLGTRLELCTQGICACFQQASSCREYRLEASIVVFTDMPYLLRAPAVVTESDSSIMAIGPDRPYTGLGEAVKLSLQVLENQMARLEADGIPTMMPLLILVTAARENHGDPELFRQMGQKCGQLIQDGRLSVMAYAASPGASLEVLQQLFPGGHTMRIDASALQNLLAESLRPASPSLDESQAIPPSVLLTDKDSDDFVMSLWNI